MTIEARRENTYWVVSVKRAHGDTYHVRRFAVTDGDLVTLDTLDALADTGYTTAGDRWCPSCSNRVRHDWVITDGVLRATCPRGHEHRRGAVGEPPPMMVDNDILGQP